jgi:tRNA(Arg) A34 adenosine deaminase TadA
VIPEVQAGRQKMDNRYLQAAIERAKQSLAEGGIPIGAVLVRKGRILGRGHNCRVQTGSPIDHGEIGATRRHTMRIVMGGKRTIVLPALD